MTNLISNSGLWLEEVRRSAADRISCCCRNVISQAGTLYGHQAFSHLLISSFLAAPASQLAAQTNSQPDTSASLAAEQLYDWRLSPLLWWRRRAAPYHSPLGRTSSTHWLSSSCNAPHRPTDRPTDSQHLLLVHWVTAINWEWRYTSIRLLCEICAA